ncbi:MAG: M28 family peptidase [Candidatus Heimdallarchaeota archaeon]
MDSDQSLEFEPKRASSSRRNSQTVAFLLLFAFIPVVMPSSSISSPISPQIPNGQHLADYNRFSTHQFPETSNVGLLYSLWHRIFDSVDHSSYHSFVGNLSEMIGPRPYGSSNNDAAVSWIDQAMNANSQSNITVETWGAHKSVVGVINGYDENLTDIFIIAGNLDTVPNSPGADDNASGVALVLEVLRVLSAYQFPRDLYFVALNAGEPPNALEGGFDVAGRLYNNQIGVQLMLNADMILNDPIGRGPRLNLYLNSPVALFAAELLNSTSFSYGTNIFSILNGQSFPSDQLAFENYGFETMCMTEATLSAHHHHHTDTIDQSVYNFTMAAEATAAVAAVAAQLAFQGVSSNTDIDNDGLNDKTELELGTDPTNSDTDNDSLSDGDEVHTYQTNPLMPDTDLDGLWDAVEITTWQTDPLQEDTDQDGLTDYEEVEIYHTDPLLADSDNDGLSDESEIRDYGTHPTVPDSDNDNIEDGEEVANGWDPLDPNDPERIMTETDESRDSPGFKWYAILGLLLWGVLSLKRDKLADQRRKK